MDQQGEHRGQGFLDHLKIAIAALEDGDAHASRDAAILAREAAPERPEAHYALGQACAALNDQAGAVAGFAEAVRLKPGWADAWVNLGLARYAQGGVEPAKAAMQRALAAQPGHAAATANLGALLRITGHPDAAEHLLGSALRRDPDNAAVRLNRVAELFSEGRAADAVALLDQASPPNAPEPARHWRLQRALGLVALNRPGEARAALAELDALGPLPDALLPLWRWRRVLIAQAEGRPAEAVEEVAAMEADLERVGDAAVLEHRIMAHYDLARFWSERRATDRAMAHWRAGHRLLRTLQPFSREAARAFSDAAEAIFTAGRFAAGPRAANGDAAPVFIVGMPRSGTTLCEQIIAAHRMAHGAGERGALGQLCWRYAGGETPEGVARIAALPQPALDEIATAYLADLHALAPDKARIVDKMPANHRFVWLIALLFPKSRIIHCVRDPRDIGFSIFTFRFHGEHGYAHDLADLGWSIAEQTRAMTHWKTAPPNPILTVALSDWVEDFDGTLARVLDFLDLPPDPACARFYEAESRVRTVSRAQVRQPVNARGIGRWKPYAAELVPLIAELEKGGALPAAG